MDSPEVVFHLLDGSQSQPVQTWKFKGQATIRIGRAEDNDVIIRQQTVSRQHAKVTWSEDRWILSNESRFGTLVEGLPIMESHLREGFRFQLGPMGPVLTLQANGDKLGDSLGTISVAGITGQEVDHAKKQQQVEEIASSDYFKRLQQVAKKLKATDTNLP